MTKLSYTFKNDVLFKMLFVQYPDLLKRLVEALLNIRYESIEKFEIRNPERPPEIIGEKFCRLDITMMIDGQIVDLEIQVKNEGDYPDRSLYYLAREYSSALDEGSGYSKLPRVVGINIVDFKMFDCAEFHSTFKMLEITRHTLLTDKIAIHYFELPKLPKTVIPDDNLRLWLSLFNANTEEELKRIESLEVPIMNKAIAAYRSITATDEFREIERMRFRARHDEASALEHARQEERAKADAKWQEIVAKERSKWQEALAVKDALIAELLAQHN
jgi:predicted transposase/invertase (TIGR01784 family)